MPKPKQGPGKTEKTRQKAEGGKIEESEQDGWRRLGMSGKSGKSGKQARL